MPEAPSPAPKLELKLPSNPDMSDSRQKSGTVPFTQQDASTAASQREGRTGVFENKTKPSKQEQTTFGGISPNFVFLQLFHRSRLGVGDDRPLALPQNPVSIRTFCY
jgi:hypothetical protein